MTNICWSETLNERDQCSSELYKEAKSFALFFRRVSVSYSATTESSIISHLHTA